MARQKQPIPVWNGSSSGRTVLVEQNRYCLSYGLCDIITGGVKIFYAQTIEPF
jgi:hypothetical protein